jgi:CheY-like chemotaxis protein
MNLLNNARDAVARVDNPVISLKVEKFEANNEFIQAHPDLGSGQLAHLIVKDNGSGISDEDKKHIFEPFYTTKGVGQGTGLGLSMSYGSVEAHCGVIEVKSTLGKGASFHIYLPAIKEKGIDTCHIDDSKLTSGEGELILIVDDNAEVRDISKDVLESIGYRVIEAEDGLQAIAQFTARKEEISLIIMDVVMPHLGGVKAAERIKAIHPDVKVIFASGYDKDEALKHEMPSSSHVLLAKPYNIIELSHLIRQQLNP